MRDRYLFGVFSVVDPMDPPVRTTTSPASPRRLFKVIDVMSGTAMLEEASANVTVRTLAAVESIFDVWIYVWIPELTTWRQLTPGEHRMLWDFRDR